MKQTLTAPIALAFAVFLLGATAPVRADLPPGTPTLAPMLKNVLPAVVNISISTKVDVRNPMFQDPFFRRFFNIPDEPQQRESQAVGSGVIVDAGKGYVLTNHHVVANADTIKVRLTDDRVIDAELVGSDEASDLAVLKIKADGLKALPFANSDDMQVGDFVVAIGNPFGVGQTVTSGIVSALGRTGLGAGRGGYENFIQTDASINPGNSGGALVDLNGRLIGINSQIVSRTGTSAGIGFSIPSNQAKFVLNEIIEHGTVERGRIGIVGQDINDKLAKAFGLPNTRGALVARVVPDSPAAKAGVKTEDIIMEIDGDVVQDFNALRNAIGLKRIGDTVKLKVLRDGKERILRVTIGKNDEQVASGSNLHPRLAGAEFAPVDESNAPDDNASGVIVTRVQARSPAARIGLRPKDIILSVNRKRVNDMDDFRKLASASETELLLHIQRGNNAFFIVIN